MTTLKNSIGLRLGIIAVLTLVLLIPALMIQSLISERQVRRDQSIKEVFDKWGNAQTVSGPILSLPFKSFIKSNDGTLTFVTKYAHILPANLAVSGNINPEIRYRGIYETVLYNTKLIFEGYFDSGELKSLNIPEQNIMWDEAFVSIGITDMRGIKELIKIRWNESELTANPGIESNDVLTSGVSAPVKIDNKEGLFEFSYSINANGSEGLFFTPLGKETDVNLSSKWNTPSFDGQFLPVKREIDENGFTAEWKILHLNRNYPQKWIGSKYQINASSFGINLLIPVDEYQKTMRTAKYSILFIALTFITFFMIELLNQKTIHPLQYLLIGFALLIFYSLLLAVSEHLLFNYAYLISALMIILLITAYTQSVLKSKLHSLLIAGILVMLYSYLFIILQLQDYALLMGSIGLFIILALVMYLTRKVDWFSIMQTDKN
ncbi:MAG: cell envelope integrity protein CreD [Ignavibacteriae bacterium]|nr:cell envelope integrity protein CreD [Ignavibacteriota bacterium]NOH00101.1 cell envelope integrity protein CreD [Ignavibacteriota bacterium]